MAEQSDRRSRGTCCTVGATANPYTTALPLVRFICLAPSPGDGALISWAAGGKKRNAGGWLNRELEPTWPVRDARSLVLPVTY